MARKNKKKKAKNSKQRAQRQQKKRQRRVNRVHEHPTKQRDGGGTDSALIDDMLTLFPYADDPNPPNPEAVMENIFMAAADTAHFIDEPEFDDIGFDPMETPRLFTEAGIKLGFEDMEELSEDEQQDAFMDIVEEIIDDILTDEIEQDIISAIEQLRNRFRKLKGKRQAVTNLAALQMVLSTDSPENKHIAWSSMGLIHALLQRSMGVGLEFMGVLDELDDVNPDPDSVQRIMEEISTISDDDSKQTKNASALRKIVNHVQSSPMLTRFLSQKIDYDWDEGLTALFVGELALDLFSEAERERAAEIFHAANYEVMKQMGLDVDLEGDNEVDDAEQDKLDAFMEQLDREEVLTRAVKIYMPQHFDLLEEIFESPQRQSALLDQLKEMLAYHLKEQTRWTGFISQLHATLDEDPDEFNYNEALIRALFGEMKPLVTVDSSEDSTVMDENLDRVVESG